MRASRRQSRLTPSERDSAVPERTARRIRLAGHVQGVGFRPFVFRLAKTLGLDGSVRNLGGEVEVIVSGPRCAIESFLRAVVDQAPALARPRLIAAEAISLAVARDFEILASSEIDASGVFVPPDSFTCPECLAELSDPHDRRYRYPFINCTQCGPRYTLIESLPYDRPNTTMSRFVLCPRCAGEYGNVRDRRFHAEPVACAQCGPSVWLEMHEARRVVRGGAALSEAVSLLRDGAVLAVKGVGGYHLMCDATSSGAVARLRERKRRPAKPFAVMYPQDGSDGVASMRRDVELSAEEVRWLLSPARPIVLARRRVHARLSCLVAPRLGGVGVFLPYSPLHHLLLSDIGRPVVATSGNVSGEPVVTEVVGARASLGRVADAILHHDRPIARPADDPVMHVVLERPRTLRIGRGVGPLELTIPCRLDHPILATGGQLKVTVALAWGNRVVVSPHIGDLGTARGARVFAQVAQDLQRLYGVHASEVICDAHPDYATSLWARESGLPVTTVPHHRAHASALAGEHDPSEPMLVFTWDGMGFGEDGTLWGGEVFVGTPGHWRRVGSLRPFRLPGAERATREPWRCAAGVCWEINRPSPHVSNGHLVRQAWVAGVNSPYTSAAGRLFDAAASLVLGVQEASYEGEAPMRLEAAARRCVPVPPGTGSGPELAVYEDECGVLRLDWRPLIEWLLTSSPGRTIAAYVVHAALAAGIVALTRAVRPRTFKRVGLTGGVFQNALLVELVHRGLAVEGLPVCLGEQIPCNDGGLSYGQIIEYGGQSHAQGRHSC